VTPLTFHLIPHTHWDREWYLPRAAFQARLVSAVGDLLDLLERDSDAHFLLDGQTIIAEDVLDVRPEWRARISAAVARGQLEVGPWYILADELVPSGESLIRNLLAGRRDANALGGRMDVLYSPDAFGHPAALPSLAAQFGIAAGATWRGLGRAGGIDRDFYRWVGPDGAEVLLYHFPAAGYEIGAELADDVATLPARWPAVREKVVSRSTTSHVAVFVGADHHAPPRDPRAMRDAIQSLEAESVVRLSSLDGFLTDASAEAANAPTLAGELRWSHGHAWTLQGTHATRARLKRQHGAAELFLQRAAEPLVALAELRGGGNLTALLRRTWRTLLQCQFHDTICGCCSDAVAAESATRLQSVAAAASEIVRAALATLTDDDPDRARTDPSATTATLLLWNPLPKPVAGIVVADLTFFRRDILVGPPNDRLPRVGGGAVGFVLVDDVGASFPVQVLSRTRGSERLDANRHYPDQDEVDRVRVAFDAPATAGFGLLALIPEPSATVATDSRMSVRHGRIANPYITLEVLPSGRVLLVDRCTGEEYPDILQLCDENDDGDSYTPQSGRAPSTRACQVSHHEVIARGPFIAALELRLRIPADRGDITARAVLSVHADSPIVRVQLTIENNANDHRLRLHLPVGPGENALSGAAFGFEQRASLNLGDAAFPAEQPLPTAPAQRYVAAGSGNRGLALFAPGFFEYERTAGGELIVTILRSTGELSRNALTARPGHAGWPLSIPEAQEYGTHAMTLCVAPLAASDRDDPARLEALWESAFLPVQTTFLRQFTGNGERLGEIGAELEGDTLVVTAMKPAESGGGIVVRCYNTAAVAVSGSWTFRRAIRSAALARADETVVRSLSVDDHHRVHFTASPRGIVTVLISPA
jgi:2-O-(6-phospho-alpha-D-mannosyl)-D-glycerate hydrolase